MKATLVQPPFVQLNAPYPAVYYLESFLRSRGLEARAFDHSIELFRLIYSKAGIERVFEAAEARLAGPDSPLGKADAATQTEIARYRSYRRLYPEWIEGVVDFLSGGDPAFAHRLASAVEFPRGARAQALLEAAGGRIGADDARELATAILDDLGDFIRFALDPEFSTIRYGDRLARSQGDFGEVEAGLSSGYLIGAFYRPWLAEFWRARRDSDLVLISVPFPGCLVGALACAQEARAALGPRATIVLGGGYVNTELRELKDPRIFDYCDYLSFDAGFGSLASIVEAVAAARDGSEAAPPLYKTMRRDGEGRILAEGFGEGIATDSSDTLRPFVELERAALASTFPDYASADYGRYLRVVDSENPMHRLWSDTPWLKYSLAHGCYWHRCAFCDTELDYVANYVPSEIEALEKAADSASARHGLYGLHFVDEAMPMGRLLAFAEANRRRVAEGKRPFSFWGNTRFDASWTQDRAELLAASGLVAVSGGIEIATGRGLELTDKGFDLEGLVRSLVALRRSGLFVHAYLIYGFPGEGRREIADSAEMVRQLFASGAVDSAFWHRFVLTRNSRLMAEWKAGAHPDLKPLDRGGSFAANDLSFEGEEAYDEFDGPLESSLEAWMAGEELEKPYPGAKIAGGLVEALIAGAEAGMDAARRDGSDRKNARRAYWLGGRLGAAPSGGGLGWVYRGELKELGLKLAPASALASASALAAALEAASRPQGLPLAQFMDEAGLGAAEPGSPGGAALAALREGGLLLV
jgi:radical SAM superfamily enzyme YgiQ (UPF0313 family)